MDPPVTTAKWLISSQHSFPLVLFELHTKNNYKPSLLQFSFGFLSAKSTNHSVEKVNQIWSRPACLSYSWGSWAAGSRIVVRWGHRPPNLNAPINTGRQHANLPAVPWCCLCPVWTPPFRTAGSICICMSCRVASSPVCFGPLNSGSCFVGSDLRLSHHIKWILCKPLGITPSSLSLALSLPPSPSLFISSYFLPLSLSLSSSLLSLSLYLTLSFSLSLFRQRQALPTSFGILWGSPLRHRDYPLQSASVSPRPIKSLNQISDGASRVPLSQRLRCLIQSMRQLDQFPGDGIRRGALGTWQAILVQISVIQTQKKTRVEESGCHAGRLSQEWKRQIPADTEFFSSKTKMWERNLNFNRTKVPDCGVLWGKMFRFRGINCWFLS